MSDDQRTRDIVPQPQRAITVGGNYELVSRGLRDAQVLARLQPVGHHIPIAESAIADFAVSPDGVFVVAGLHDGTFLVWDAESATRKLHLSHCSRAEPGWLHFSFNQANDTVAFDAYDGHLSRAEVNLRTGILSAARPDQEMEALWMLAERTFRASGAWHLGFDFPECYLKAIDRFSRLERRGGILHLYGPYPSSEHTQLSLVPELQDPFVDRVAFSPDGAFVYCSASQARAAARVTVSTSCLWDLRSRGRVAQIHQRTRPWAAGKPGIDYSADCVDGYFSPDGSVMVTMGDQGNGISVWDVEKGCKVRLLPAREVAVCAAFSGESRQLVIGTRSRMLEVWDVQSATLRQSLGPNPGFILEVRVSADALTVAAVSSESIHEPEWLSIWTVPGRGHQ